MIHNYNINIKNSILQINKVLEEEYTLNPQSLTVVYPPEYDWHLKDCNCRSGRPHHVRIISSWSVKYKENGLWKTKTFNDAESALSFYETIYKAIHHITRYNREQNIMRSGLITENLAVKKLKTNFVQGR